MRACSRGWCVQRIDRSSKYYVTRPEAKDESGDE